MSIIACEECGGKVSDKAAACPHCGAPVLSPEPVVTKAELQIEKPTPEKLITTPTASIASSPQVRASSGVSTEVMHGIFVFKNGAKVPANIVRLFGQRGPFVLDGKRLDLLSKVQMVVDSSTSTATHVGVGSSTASTGNMLKRAVVGGLLTGGLGAVVGGATGKRETITNTKTTEVIDSAFTAELLYADGSSQYVFLNTMEAFHWLLGFVNEGPYSEENLKEDRLLYEEEKTYKIMFDASKRLNPQFESEFKSKNREPALPLELNGKYKKKTIWVFIILTITLIAVDSIFLTPGEAMLLTPLDKVWRVVPTIITMLISTAVGLKIAEWLAVEKFSSARGRYLDDAKKYKSKMDAFVKENIDKKLSGE